MSDNIVNDEDFPSNSNAKKVAPIRPTTRVRMDDSDIQQPKKKRVRAVVKGIRKKRSFTETIAESLVGEGKDVGHYVLWDVLIPAAKNTIQEMVTSGIEMFLFGERTSPRDRNRKDKSRVSYSSFYRERDRDDDRRPSSRSNGRFKLDNIFFRSGKECDRILNELLDTLEEYEQVTVADYYALAGVDNTGWAEEKWGWEKDMLARARCTHTRDGFMIMLPKPVELD